MKNINNYFKEAKAYSIRGSDMGRLTIKEDSSKPLYLQKVRLDSGGYDAGGAYWGAPDDLYCAFNEDMTFRVFTRAYDRIEAKVNLNTLYDDLIFVR
jgi:hypothetical protein